MKKDSISNLALAGVLGGSLAFGAVGCSGPSATSQPGVSESRYSKIHGCAGKNACKGIGGCKVTQAKLEKLAAAAGTAMGDAGEPHGCSGMNSCRGLGGCSVDAGKLAKLEAKMNK